MIHNGIEYGMLQAYAEGYEILHASKDFKLDQEAIDLSVPAPVITLALQMRFRSRQQDSFAAKVVAALRKGFGGHATKKA